MAALPAVRRSKVPWRYVPVLARKPFASSGITSRVFRRTDRYWGGLRSNVVANERQEADHRPITLSIRGMSDEMKNEVLRSIISSGSVVTEDGKIRAAHSGVSREEGEFLQEMIRRARPQVSVEVGCAYGISSLYICEALREVNAIKHIIIDPYQHSVWEDVGLANLRRAGYADIIDFHEVFSYQYLSRLTEERVTIDFAFIDGAHTFDYVLVDFFLIDKLLRPGGIVILDDLSYPSIRSVCRYVLSNLHYKCIAPQLGELPEQVRWRRRLVSRVHRDGIGPLLRAPLSRIFVPGWRMLRWRIGQLASVPLRRILVSSISLTDSQLNLPAYSNYIALQKLGQDDRHWTHHRAF
jgi:predicted O-methyltransferase YrrM